MRLQITHETHYDYVPAVETAQHMCYLQPPSQASQTLLAHTLLIDPTPEEQTLTRDVYGNARSFFSLQTAHSQLNVVARSIVQTQTQIMPSSKITWEQTRERFRFATGNAYDAAAEFVFTSPYVIRHADFAAYARPSFVPGAPLVLAARDLMRRIHTEFVYETASTQVNTPALDALNQRKGVCQDFAHIMVACMRAMGLPARYVSGYLLTEPPPGVARLVGSDASHAWASIYVPDWPQDAHWCDFDPTNNRDGCGSPGEDYVTLAMGRDYADVSPIRGVIHGGANHTLRVGVTVEPADWGGQSQTQTQSQGLRQNQTQTNAPGFSQSQSQSQSQSWDNWQGPT
jgi:transglutaminase-like putative cysteine protease